MKCRIELCCSHCGGSYWDADIETNIHTCMNEDCKQTSSVKEMHWMRVPPARQRFELKEAYYEPKQLMDE